MLNGVTLLRRCRFRRLVFELLLASLEKMVTGFNEDSIESRITEEGLYLCSADQVTEAAEHRQAIVVLLDLLLSPKFFLELFLMRKLGELLFFQGTAQGLDPKSLLNQILAIELESQPVNRRALVFELILKASPDGREGHCIARFDVPCEDLALVVSSFGLDLEGLVVVKSSLANDRWFSVYS